MKSIPRILFSLTGIAFAASLVIAACSSDTDPAKNVSAAGGSTSTGGSSSLDSGVVPDASDDDAGDQ